MKRWLKKLLLIICGSGVVGIALFGAQVELKWIASYETMLFDTTSGWIEDNQYALMEAKDAYFIKLPGEVVKEVALDFDLTGLTEVNIIGKAYFHTFLDDDGQTVIREQATKSEYKALAGKSASQPTRTKNTILGRTANAAIAFDANTSSGHQNNASSITFAHTVAADGNMLLHVGVGMNESTEGDREVSTVTYNGDTVNKVREDENTGDNTETVIYQLAGPDTGSSYNVVVTFVGTNTSSIAYATSLSGVDQSSPVDAQNGQAPSNQDNVSTSVTTVADNAWIIDMVQHESVFASALTPGGSQTEMNDVDGGNFVYADSRYESVSPPASTAMTWNDGGAAGSGDWTHSVVSYKPFIDPCAAPATGDWQVHASDNCYVDSDTTIQGDLIILADDGPGTFNLIDGAVLSVHCVYSTSTPIHVEAGSDPKIESDCRL